MRVSAAFLALACVVVLSSCVAEVHTTGPGPAQTYDVGTFTVQNSSSIFIYYIYASPTSQSTWGSDLLGSDVLAPGERCSIDLAPGYWDLKVVTEDGQEFVYWNQDFTNVDHVVTIYDQ